MAARPHIGVLGAGAWGTALANLAARHDAKVHLWARDPAHVAEMAATGVNARRGPGAPLAASIVPTHALEDMGDANAIYLVVPAQAVRQTCEALAGNIASGTPIVICAKGIERTTRLFLSDIVAEILPSNPPAVLSGPSFAQDVAKGLPTAVTLAAQDEARAADLGKTLAAPWFRLYHSRDIRGVEIGGAAKNVFAIASGVAAGLNLGASANAALIARGFAELSRFGRAYGAEMTTLAGLSGLGDLVLTCTSGQSRNFSLGFTLGRGMDVVPALASSQLAEGASTASALVELAQNVGVEMPIAASVDALLNGEIEPGAAVSALLGRPPKAE